MKRFETVNEFVASSDQWHDELVTLRTILTSCGLDETIKWGAPCYTYQGKNVVGIGAFKSYCGSWFYQGALLSDAAGVLMNAQEGKTKALRQWRFQHKNEIKSRTIKRYVREAIELVEAGKNIKPTRTQRAVTIPKELQQALRTNPRTKDKFDALSPSCRREYAEYVSEAKRDETKQRRIKKIFPMILSSEGLHDQYRK